MTVLPHITVAPNGARLQKADHAGLPVSVSEVIAAAVACHAAGADAIHMHVRSPDGAHSLDTGLYREAIAGVARAVPGMGIQVTTEAAGVYGVPAQLALLEELRPGAASIAVREIARAPDLAGRVYATAAQAGTRVQHILYGAPCFEQLADWLRAGVVPGDMRDALLVLGQYTPPRAGAPEELPPFEERAGAMGLRMTLCAFGAQEQACLLAAARLGWNLRVGFENNRTAPDGSEWPDNAASVASLVAALEKECLR